MKNSKLFLTVALGALAFASPWRAVAQSAPSIDTQPGSLTVTEGQDAVFTVSASGTDPLLYQWYFNGSAILDATNSALLVASAQVANAGDYTVSISNDFGGVLSDIATLTVESGTPPSDGPETFLDFNKDGHADLLWAHPNGTLAAWLMDGTNFLSSITLPYTVTPGWKMAGQGDIDGDGKFDFLWQHSNGRLAAWLMDGTNRLATISIAKRPTGGWRVVGVTDLDKDGSIDILWQHGNGYLAAWMMNGTNVDHSLMLNDGKRFQGGWKVVGLMDMDGDNDEDILWQHGGGRIGVWYMDGTTVSSKETYKYSQNTSSSWKIVGNTDLNGDGENDLVWQNSNGYLALWFMNGTSEPVAAPLRKGKAVGPGWTVENH